MNNVLKSVKKIFTVSVVGATLVWAVGVQGLVPDANAAVCPTLNAGDMIKVSGYPAIYSIDKNGKQLYFPDGDVFKSWTGLSATAANQYAGYVTVTQACFNTLSAPATLPIGVNFRPGSYVFKRPATDQLYVALPGNTKAKISMEDAKALYGANFKAMTIKDENWANYANSAPDVVGKVHEGMLVSKDGKTWYVAAGGVLREVTETGMTANRFKSAFVHSVPASYLAGTTVGTPISALESVLANRTQDGAIATPVGGTVNVSLAADNPAAANIADASAYNKVLKLNFSASSATQVTGITLTKTGLIANSNISGVSVWDMQGNRRGEVMTSLTSDNKVTISFGSNPLAIGAGSSESLVVAVNIANISNASGLVGFSVAAATDIASNGTAAGSFPIVGNQMNIVEGSASLASVSATGVAVGGSNSQPDASDPGNLQIGDVEKEVSKIRFTESSGNEDVAVSKLTLYVEGTVQDSDLANWSLYAPNGDKLAMSPSLSNRYVTLSLATPYVIPKSTSRDLTVKVDVVNGSTRNFRVHLQSDYDVMLLGKSTGFYVLPSSFSDVFSTNGWFNMGSGSLVLNKSADSPAGNISAGAQNLVLAKLAVKATGEKMEVRKMGLSVANTGYKNLTGNVTVRDAADGTVYLTVAASTAALYTGGQQFTLSSYLTLDSNQTKVLEVVGSVDATATSGNKYTVGIGNFYAKRLSTIDFVDGKPTASNSGTTANQLTVNATSLSCYKDTSMGNVTHSTGSTVVVGQFICTAGSSEDVRLSGLTFSFTGAGPTVANSYQNLALFDGDTAPLGNTISTVASSSNSFNFTLNIPKNQTKTLKLKAYVVPGQTTGTLIPAISSGSYSGVESNNTGSISTVTGQTVTIGTGNLNITYVGDATTQSKIYGPDQTGILLGKWKFAAANDTLTLKKLTMSAVNSNGTIADGLGLFGTLSLYEDGGVTPVATANYVAGDVVFTGMNSQIPMNGDKTYVLKANTTGSGTLTSNSTTAFVVKSDSNSDMEVSSAAGSLLGTATINYNAAVDNGAAESRFATGTTWLFHDAYPTISSGAIPSDLTFTPTTKLFKFSVVNSGARAMKLASTTIDITVTGLMATDKVYDFKLYEANQAGDIGTQLAIVNNATTTSSTTNVSISFNTANDLSNGAGGGLLDDVTINPNSTRTFIVTGNTSLASVNKTSGQLTAYGRISGTTGWNGSSWNTGNLFYVYTPANGSQLGPFSASDSYEVMGQSVSHNF